MLYTSHHVESRQVHTFDHLIWFYWEGHAPLVSNYNFAVLCSHMCWNRIKRYREYCKWIQSCSIMLRYGHSFCPKHSKQNMENLQLWFTSYIVHCTSFYNPQRTELPLYIVCEYFIAVYFWHILVRRRKSFSFSNLGEFWSFNWDLKMCMPPTLDFQLKFVHHILIFYDGLSQLMK